MDFLELFETDNVYSLCKSMGLFLYSFALETRKSFTNFSYLKLRNILLLIKNYIFGKVIEYIKYQG